MSNCRIFCHLKNWRRIAIRYDRHAASDLAGIALVAAIAERLK
jgi:transposase